MIRFIKNIWNFRKELTEWRWWDYSYPLMLLKRSIELSIPQYRDRGLEVEEKRFRKVAEMELVVKLINKHLDQDYIEEAEKALGKERNHESSDYEHDREIYTKSYELELKDWKQIFNTLRGDWDFDNTSGSHGMRDWWD